MKTITINITLTDSQYSQLESRVNAQQDLSVEGWVDQVLTDALLSQDIETTNPTELFFNEIKVEVK